jgi:hypothetical protein
MITTDNVISKLTKKHPANYGITASESTHCVLGRTIYAFVETVDEKLMYGTDKAGRVRLLRTEKLTPTYKNVRNDPKNSAVIIRGGKYDGHYIVRHNGEGWLTTSTDSKDVTLMQAYYAQDHRNYIAHNAQYCYRGTFEVVTID